MNVNLAVLCDAANVSREGKLNILGEFDSIHVATFPLVYPTMVLVVRLEAHPTEAGEHSLKLHLVDEDGEIDVHSSTTLLTVAVPLRT